MATPIPDIPETIGEELQAQLATWPNAAQEPQDIIEQRQTTRQAAYQLMDGINHFVVGLPHIVRRVVMGLFADGQIKPGKTVCGHILLEAVPGTAKTLLSETLAALLQAPFSRIQMDADKRPNDILGYYDTDPTTNTLVFQKGPIFANIVLIDEINRARPEVKGALLQAMAEREVSIDTTTYQLEEPFLVLANQNPIEQEGTYPLIEAELDRFIAKIRIDYIPRQQEVDMLQRVGHYSATSRQSMACLNAAQVVAMRDFIRQHTYIDPAVIGYAVDLVRATRPETPLHAACLADLTVDGRSVVQIGASPRASLFLMNYAKVEAFLGTSPQQAGRAHVMPTDIATVAYDVLNHRLILHEVLVHTLLGKRPIPYLNAALRFAGDRILHHRDELLQQILRRILRGVRLP
ncbi:MAG: AAA family ATPase [bacterium]|nr:AAA family ATPase [bacterium]